MEDLFCQQLGGTKKQEYIRSAELFAEICKTQSPYLALAFLLDSQYNNSDLKEILKYMNPKQN
jgi:hypothetical protein